MEALARYEPRAVTWFRLGDRDLATHLYRTQRLAEGATLTETMAEIAAAWKVDVRLLPMSDDPVETRMRLAGGEGEIAFQDYFVRRRHAVAVDGVRFAGAADARPGPGVLNAIAEADVVVICPSNPIVSIDPILAVPGIREAVRAARRRTVAISPIVAGVALKGPADRLLAELGHEVSVVGVARLYAPLAATLVVDEADAALAAAVEAAGVACVVTPSIMHGIPEAAALASAVLAAGATGAARR
jgi:LPPG:FO 2-phospho-L-lactate transferase